MKGYAFKEVAFIYLQVCMSSTWDTAKHILVGMEKYLKWSVLDFTSRIHLQYHEWQSVLN